MVLVYLGAIFILALIPFLLLDIKFKLEVNQYTKAIQRLEMPDEEIAKRHEKHQKWLQHIQSFKWYKFGVKIKEKIWNTANSMIHSKKEHVKARHKNP